MKKIKCIYFILIGICSMNFLFGQEQLKPLKGNINLIYAQPKISYPNQHLQKVTALYDTLPFFEDFYYAPNSPYPSGAHWIDSSVYINTGFAKAPPSIGVASFDGLNKQGYPYNLSAQPVVSAPADTLTSRPISLYSQSGYTYSPADSIAITFLYQRAGFGENPEVNDSLILDFYKPLYPIVSGTTVIGNGAWFRVWSTRGNNSPSSTDSSFKRAFVRISDTAYFHNGFKFRFRNKATSSGSVDHWNIDYVNLKKNYFKTDTVYNEVAFGYMPRHILKNYSSMPYYQYNSNEMRSKFSCFIRNNSVGIVKNTNYEYSIINSSGAVLSTYGSGSSNTGNVNPFVTRGWDSVLTHKNPPVNYTFSPMSDSTHFYIKHAITSNPDVWKYNDTIYQKLEFNNFYAYDDGSAEAGYYLNTIGAKTALRYTLNTTDTLHGLDIYFDPITEGHLIEVSLFRLSVWADGGGSPGLLIRKDSTQKPKYLKYGHNKMPRYFFTSPMILSPGTYYFGITQGSSQELNIGFDRNFDHHDALYYDVSGFWQQSSIPGSLMIHPIMGASSRAMVGIKETETQLKKNYLKIYPNPANNKLVLDAPELDPSKNYTIELHSVIGSTLLTRTIEATITELNISDFSSGIYFVVLKTDHHILSQDKLIISH